jgi:rubrerythrin
LLAVDVKAALAVIETAIQNEIAGRRFYDEASRYCIDLWAKEVFASLASDEERHAQLLLGEHESLSQQGQWLDPADALKTGESVDITRISFSDGMPGAELFPPGWAAGDAIDRTWDDLAALAFGIGLEKAAIALYQAEATKVSDTSALRAFNFLVSEEERHYHQLVDRWEQLAGVEFER